MLMETSNMWTCLWKYLLCHLVWSIWLRTSGRERPVDDQLGWQALSWSPVLVDIGGSTSEEEQRQIISILSESLECANTWEFQDSTFFWQLTQNWQLGGTCAQWAETNRSWQNLVQLSTAYWPLDYFTTSRNNLRAYNSKLGNLHFLCILVQLKRAELPGKWAEKPQKMGWTPRITKISWVWV